MPYGGPDGELAASLRYLSQRFSAPNDICRAVLNDVGTEELGHLEMVGAIVHQLTKNLTIEEIKKQGFGDYYTDHGVGVYPVNASGVPFSASVLAVKDDPIADLVEDLAAEQKARATYEKILMLADDPDVIEPIKFLRAREIVHFQRFGEALRTAQESMSAKKNFYMNNRSMVSPMQNSNSMVSPMQNNKMVSPIQDNNKMVSPIQDNNKMVSPMQNNNKQ